MNAQPAGVDTAPPNLFEALKGGLEGFRIETGYSLELVHGLWGYFPAIYAGTRWIVVTFDQALIEDVWKGLSPRKSKMNATKFHVSDELGICYPILGDSEYDQEQSKPIRFLTRQRFQELTAGGDPAFEWAPGLIGPDMTLEEFRKTVEAARDKQP